MFRPKRQEELKKSLEDLINHIKNIKNKDETLKKYKTLYDTILIDDLFKNVDEPIKDAVIQDIYDSPLGFIPKFFINHIYRIWNKKYYEENLYKIGSLPLTCTLLHHDKKRKNPDYKLDIFIDTNKYMFQNPIRPVNMKVAKISCRGVEINKKLKEIEKKEFFSNPNKYTYNKVISSYTSPIQSYIQIHPTSIESISSDKLNYIEYAKEMQDNLEYDLKNKDPTYKQLSNELEELKKKGEPTEELYVYLEIKYDKRFNSKKSKF